MTLEDLRGLIERNKTVEITERNTVSLYPYPNGICNNLNMSDINTLLIKQAAEHCEYYASDVVYDINALERKIIKLALFAIKGRVTAPVTERIFIGFRDMGVDGTTFVCSRVDYRDDYLEIAECYKALYVAEIHVGEPEGYYPTSVDVEVRFYGMELEQAEDEEDGEGGEGNA